MQLFLNYDINNEYEVAMSEFLPYINFKWVESVFQIDFINIPDDLIWHIQISFMIYMKISPSHFVPPASKCKIPKLVTNLLTKTIYIVHYRNLKQYLSSG